MLTKIIIAVMTVSVLATTYASAATRNVAQIQQIQQTQQNQKQNARTHADFQKIWFSLAEGQE